MGEYNEFNIKIHKETPLPLLSVNCILWDRFPDCFLISETSHQRLVHIFQIMIAHFEETFLSDKCNNSTYTKVADFSTSNT
jgi:hypothetical protein